MTIELRLYLYQDDYIFFNNLPLYELQSLIYPLKSLQLIKTTLKIKSNNGKIINEIIQHYLNKLNLDIKCFKHGSIELNNFLKLLYNYNPKKCLYCNKDISYEQYKNYKDVKFCCNTCSAIYNNKLRGVRSEETKLKIRNTLKNKPHIKKYCKICGKEITIKNYRGKFCCNECKCINKYYNTLVKYFNLSIDNIGTINFLLDIQNIKNILINLYWHKKLSFLDIADIYNYPYPGNLSKIFKYLNIDIRTTSDSAINSYLNNKHQYKNINTKYKAGWHKTWDNQNVYLRSSYELNYANYLDEQKIVYEVESLRINYYDSVQEKYRCAIPDFYLPDTNEIVEVKSTWTLNYQNMKDRVLSYKKLGYNFKLILNNLEVIDFI